MISEAQRAAWERDGFFIIRGFAAARVGEAMAEETVAAIRADPPSAHPGEPSYATVGDLIVQPEAKPVETAVAPEDHVAKLFNPHLNGTARDFALDSHSGAIVSDLLGPDVDVFQSMFIFKNAGHGASRGTRTAIIFASTRGRRLACGSRSRQRRRRTAACPSSPARTARRCSRTAPTGDRAPTRAIPRSTASTRTAPSRWKWRPATCSSSTVT